MVILGMDWLAPCRVVLDIYSKIMTLASPGVPRIAWKGIIHSVPKRVIFFFRIAITRKGMSIFFGPYS